ncbi:MAG: S46 family peptidase [Candidatus Aminicenantes bacterium]|nr:S46 family peptidase [Candidatus Aminicenantes bacterium]
MKAHIIFAILLAASVSLPAVEGMFPVDGITPAIAADMRAMGCRFDPSRIWRPGEPCMAMAVVNLGASGAFVSADGLILTNHHVAFGAVQSLSSPEHNYIRDGFLARNRGQEIPAPGYSVRVMTGFENVTPHFRRALLPGLSAKKRRRRIEKISRELVARGERAAGSECRIARFYGGGEFYRVTYMKIRDMRVVYVPARSIGEYGGETDNWMWPRHTGDFSFLRAYVGPDGRPADHSPDNVPFRPRHHFPVARTPLRPGDFTLILGYPGTTERWHAAAEVANEVQVRYPGRVALLEGYIELVERMSASDEAVRIKNAGMLKGLHNSIKNNRGLLAALERDAVLETKRDRERELASWIAAAPERGRKYGLLLDGIERLAADEREIIPLSTISGWLRRGCRLLDRALTLNRWGHEKGKKDAKRAPGYQERDIAAKKQRLPVSQRSLDLATDRTVLAFFLRNLLENDRSGTFAKLAAEVDGRPGRDRGEKLAALVDSLYRETRLADLEFTMRLFAVDAKALAATRDPFLQLAAKLQPGIDALQRRRDAVSAGWLELKPIYVEAMMRAYPDRPRYPDANGTLRFSYGRVEGYAPRDAMRYAPFTTLAGVLAKNRGEPPFNLSPGFLAAASGPGRARHDDEALGDVPVNFLTSNDSTGGNSGSPVLNADGELVGVLFDGNYESLGSDFLYRPDITRSIHVDMRYIRFVAEEVDRAAAVLRELGLR